MSNILPVKDDVNDGLQGGHGKHVKMEQDGRIIMDLRKDPPVEAVFTEEEAMLRKFRGDYTDIPADAPVEQKTGGKK